MPLIAQVLLNYSLGILILLCQWPICEKAQTLEYVIYKATFYILKTIEQ